MRYVPGLIPDHARVKGFGNMPLIKRPVWWLFISYFGAVCFLLPGVANIFSRFWEGFFFLLIGFLLLPGVHNSLEQKLRFKLTWLIKTILFMVFLFTATGFSSSYDKEDELAARELKAEEARLALLKEEERLAAEMLAKARSDSLNKHLNKAENDIKRNHVTSGIAALGAALNFVDTGHEHILSRRAALYYRAGRYEQAIEEYSSLINSGNDASNHLYQRARCYEKLHKRREAVNDLKRAIDLGNTEAEELHERVNPLKRRIAYYVTRCCDGTTSSAKGRGACSHHGGVCNWNDPVYENYRKYG